MKEFARFLIAAVLYLSAFHPASATDSPSADEILEKAIAKAKSAASNCAPYQFTQVTVREERDTDGSVKERKEDSDEVSGSAGSFLKSRRSKKTAKATDSDPLKLKKYKCSDRSDALNLLTPELIGRYTVQFVQKTDVNGRSTFQLAFQARDKTTEGKDFIERVLNQASGTLWIDAEEYELAKAEIKLNSEIPVGSGILGSLKKALVVLERIRLEGGVWLDRFYKTDYEARKLVASKHVVTWCEARNFRKVPARG